MAKQQKETRNIIWFDEIGIADTPLVGGKNASLGELYRELTPNGVRVPNGFAVTAHAYFEFLNKNQLEPKIVEILKGLDTHKMDNLRSRGQAIRQLMMNASLPESLVNEIQQAYDILSQSDSGPADVAVRSSATAEDLPTASFAGQQETYLNVQGHSALLEACKRCFASLYTDRAISYRVDQGFEKHRIGLSIGIQHMVRSDLATAGVMFSIDTETGFADAVLINAAYGLGENVVLGTVNPDEFFVHKPTLAKGFRPIIRKRMGSKEYKLVYDTGGGKMTRNLPVAPIERQRFCLNDDDILTLARWACQIESHYSSKRGQFSPMDMEWAKDGRTGDLYVVQARPETVQSQKTVGEMESYRLKTTGKLLVQGRSVGQKIGQGKTHIIESAKDLHLFRPGEVLVTDKTDPDWEPTMKTAAAVVTNRGGRTCHAAIVSRELGLPAVVGTETGTEILRDAKELTVSCAEGDTGKVYEGLLPIEIEKQSFQNLKHPRTQIMMNVANPDEAFRLSALPNDGVGLARMEFIISNTIRIHPNALLDFENLKDHSVKNQIEQLTSGYDEKPRFFVEKLSEGVAMIAAAFYPRDVIIRLSDFKTNEYANLVGGKPYEPLEENPMIGFRGASRYYNPRYRDGFALECQAMKRVRDEMGLTNLKIMIPFCRTVDEGKKVLDEMARHGLVRGTNGLQVYVMCEIPSNVIMAKEFAEIFDGFSIGSNDLTQLILGVDRDSEIVAPIFDERNPAVMRMIADVIREVHNSGRKIGICGQAPSDYPEFARFLVEQGIDSLSLNPDAVLPTMQMVQALEETLSNRN